MTGLLEKAKDNVQKVYEAGKKAEYDTFWDNYQDYGNRTNYGGAFKGSWNDEIFKPKYNMILSGSVGAVTMFQDARIEDLKGCLERQGVRLDTSQCPSLLQMFQSSKTKYIPLIDARLSTNCAYTFASSSIITIDKFLVSENTIFSTSTFSSTKSLEHVIFEGAIAQNNLNLSASVLLDKASIASVINALSSTTTGLTVTLSKVAVNNAFGIDVDDVSTYPEGSEYYILRQSKSNWTISYV